MRPSRTTCALLAVLAGALLECAGCMPAVGWLVNTFAPPKKIDALYKPPAGKTMLVFVDDLINPVSYEPIKGELTAQLNSVLEANKVSGRTVRYEDLLSLMASTPGFNRLSVSEVGQKLGADIVLYVKIDRFSLKENEATPLWQGTLATTVRMVEVQKGRLWPDDRPEGYPVRPAETTPQTHPSPTYGEVLSKILAIQMADRIGKLFYDHSIPADEARQQEATRDSGMDSPNG